MTKGIPRTLKNVKNSTSVRHIKVAKTVTVSATGNAVGFGTVVIGDFLPGNVYMAGVVAYMQISGSGSDSHLTATWEGDFSIGTTPTADVTLSGTDVDIIGSTALPAAVAEVGSRVRAVNATPAIFDNTDGSLEINLNVLVDAAHITDDQSVTLTVTGDLFINYVILGDD